LDDSSIPTRIPLGEPKEVEARKEETKEEEKTIVTNYTIDHPQGVGSNQS
jgi:hypothetical protein